MKTKIIFLCISAVALLVGCSSEKDSISSGKSSLSTESKTVATGKSSLPTESKSLSYEDFKSQFLKFKIQFKPEKFSNISPEVLSILTTSFPKTNLDNRQTDIINNSMESPARYELFYKSNEPGLLVKVNFIYFPSSKENQFTTINSISPTRNTNIVEKQQKIVRPLLDEYLLSLNGYLVLINFIDTSNPTNHKSEKYNTKFIASTLTFYSQFEKELLAINKQN
ncbi:hypothetical protein [Aneurinibacillus tyrosinisolvens]|uniref:hypothetical protein n=1 Tax=Aneurinibacillus tyrosinisolvens TaxID=1443435 RepID=UPI00063EE011|nr:hypothetical protein [Aneurinibacillus tyrosinisolvens]